MSGSHAIRSEGNTIYFRVRGTIDEADIQILIDLGDSLAAQHGQFWVLVYAQEMTTITTEARRLGGMRRRREGTIAVAYDLPAGGRRIAGV